MISPELMWNKDDIESKLFFTSKKYTGVNAFLSFIGAILLTLIFYLAIVPFSVYGPLDLSKNETTSPYAWTVNMFFHGTKNVNNNRSVIPYITMLFSCWCASILLFKSRKFNLQRRALEINIVPQDPDFVLAPRTAEQILRKMYEKVDEPKKFVLLNRIERCLSNLKNIGRVSDVSAGLESQAQNDENYFESTYTVIRGFIWAIPVLGFIGTVLGLSQAVSGFGGALTQGADLTKLKTELTGVTSGLAVAFETTLIALIAALMLQIWLTMLKKNEEDFLDECSDYCHRNIISKLKTIDTQQN